MVLKSASLGRSGCPIPAIPAASAAGVVEHGVEHVDERHLGDDAGEQVRRRLATAPISMPPALPPWPTMRRRGV
jgi:hypothetical protein